MFNNDEEELNYYRNLKINGYVYDKYKPENCYSVKELLFKVLKEKEYEDDEIKIFLNFSHEVLENGDLLLKKETQLRKQKFLFLSKQLAKIYKKENKFCASRSKRHIDTNEMVIGKTGTGNYYPIGYKNHVEDFLFFYPIDIWGRNFDNDIDSESELDVLEKISMYMSKC